MFWSKIWFFIVALCGIAAATAAFIMPRPAERTQLADHDRRIKQACNVVGILMRDHALQRINVARAAAAHPSIRDVAGASDATKISRDRHRTAQRVAKELLSSGGKADKRILFVLNRTGRVLTRVGSSDDSEYGDSMRGYHLVDDALHGFAGDDLWVVDNRLYLMAAAPIAAKDLTPYPSPSGAVLIGNPASDKLAERLVGRTEIDGKVSQQLDAHLTLYGGSFSRSNPKLELDTALAEHYSKLGAQSHTWDQDCEAIPAFEIESSGQRYDARISRLPGEAGELGAFYAVVRERPGAIGFNGMLSAANKSDLGFGKFPWLLLGGGFLVAVAIGLVLMIVENDRPLRRLNKDALALAQGDSDRLDETGHKGRWGSIARSINIQLDKQQREASAANKGLDELLGPGPVASVGFHGGAASALPETRPDGSQESGAGIMPSPDFDLGGIPAPPPPGSGAFDLPPPPPTSAGAPPIPRAATAPPPVPGSGIGTGPLMEASDTQVAPEPVSLPEMPANPPVAAQVPAAAIGKVALKSQAVPVERMGRPGSITSALSVANAIDADILGDDPQANLSQDEKYRAIFDEFVAMKESCGESTANLTFERFTAKLDKNSAALMEKHGCQEVRFKVYSKDGKAALKATPVKNS